MKIIVNYEPYDDSYDVRKDVFASDYQLWYISVDGKQLSVSTYDNTLCFISNSSDIMVKYCVENEVEATECNFGKIAEHFEPLIKEILLTGDIELMVYLHRSLFPLLNRVVITQRMIDEYEFPQKVPTKSSRN